MELYINDMRKLIFIPLLLASLICSATNYYVKNAGNDANTGLSDDQAWKTINKINTSTFSAGDTIFFNKGDTWREELTTPSSGTSGAYIVFSTYGTGDIPQILGSEFENTWTDGDITGVAASNDLLEESFEGVGYEETWTEQVGTNAGCVVDEDNTDVARPTGGGDQILKLVKVITPNGTSAGSCARIIHDYGSVQPIVYADFYVMINAHGLASNGNAVALFRLNDGAQDAMGIELINNAGSIQFEIWSYRNSTINYEFYPESGSITLNQWYHIQMSYDVTNGTYSTVIDGINVWAGSIVGTSATGTRYVYVGSYSDIHTITAYFDLVNISSTNFYRATISIPDNVWVSDGTYTDPSLLSYHGNIFYLELDDSIKWGLVQKSYVDDLAEEYDWAWVANKICIYSPTDPNSRYSGVEIAQRTSCVDLAYAHYLTFDSLELAYGGRYGIVCNEAGYPWLDISGLTVQNCHIHHLGSKINASGGEGYGLGVWYSNMLIKGNFIHDASRRLISLNLNTQVINPHNIVIEDNTFYDGYHTSGPDINTNAAGTWDSIIVRRNLFYQNTDPIDDVENPSSREIFIAVQGLLTGAVTKIYIYDNIFFVPNQISILLEHTNSVYIYNNTFYQSDHAGVLLNGSFIGASGAGTCVIKNNLFYNDMSYVNNNNFRNISIGSTFGTTTLDYNLYYNTDAAQTLITWRGTGYTQSQWATYKAASSQDANSPTPADPVFVNNNYSLYVSPNNYYLRSTSPAIGMGIDLGLVTDYGGMLWKNPPSLGACEYYASYISLLRSGGKLLRTSGGKLIRQ